MIPRANTRDILVTGGTGFLGHYIVAELLQQPRARCRVLLRPPLTGAIQRLRALLADLGVDADAHFHRGSLLPIEGYLPGPLDVAALRGVGTVLHAAGSVRFDTDHLGEPSLTNVEGTRSLLKVADEAGIPHFAMVSTAYVCGKSVGTIREVVQTSPPLFFNDYERSKWLAEQLVNGWRNDSRRTTILRPSILIGDRKSGRATSMSGLYVIARATQILARAVSNHANVDRHQIPLRIAGRGDACVNVVPVCIAAKQIVNAVLAETTKSSVYHVTNPTPPTHQDVKDWLEDYFDVGGGEFVDTAGPLANPNSYEELFYDVSRRLTDYFRHGVIFEQQDSTTIASCDRLVDREMFDKCIAYAESTNWGRRNRALEQPRPALGHVDPAWYFEVFLPACHARSAVAKINTLTTSVRFRVGEIDRDEWTCRFDHGRLAEVRRASSGPEEEFGYRINLGSFADVVRGRISLQQTFFLGLADLLGNYEQALKMVPVMEAFLREFPVGIS